MILGQTILNVIRVSALDRLLRGDLAMVDYNSDILFRIPSVRIWNRRKFLAQTSNTGIIVPHTISER